MCCHRMTSLNPAEKHSWLTWTWRLEGSWTMAVPFTLRSNTPLVPEQIKQQMKTERGLMSDQFNSDARVITCCSDEPGSSPRVQLQVVDQCAHGQGSQRVRVPLISSHWEEHSSHDKQACSAAAHMTNKPAVLQLT